LYFGLPPVTLPLLPGSFQLAVAFGVDLLSRPASMSCCVIQPVALFKRTLL